MPRIFDRVMRSATLHAAADRNKGADDAGIHPGLSQCVMTTSTLQCACSINAGDVEPRHHRAAHPS